MKGKESQYTSEYIKSLKGYQNIIALGVDDTSSKTIGKNQNTRFQSEELLGREEPSWMKAGTYELPLASFTVYQKGAFRRKTSTTPAVIRRWDTPLYQGLREEDEERWIYCWIWLLMFTIRKNYPKLNHIWKFSNAKKWGIGNAEDYAEFYLGLIKSPLAAEARKLFLDLFRDQIISDATKNDELLKEFAKELEENPGKFILSSKGHFPNELVDEVLSRTSFPESEKNRLRDEFGLQNDLSGLGF